MKALKVIADRLGLFPDANGRKAASSGSGVNFVGAPNWRNVIRFDSLADPEADELTLSIAYLTSAYAFTAIDFRARCLSEPPLKVYRETKDGFEEDPTHELDSLLEEPSPDFDVGELLYLTESYRLTTGGALWLKLVDGANRVGRLMPFSAQQFATESDPAEGLIYGRYRIETGHGDRYADPSDVIHFREINPNSWREGVNRLEVALSRLDLGHQIDLMVRNFARRAMFPGGVISPHADWDPDDEEWNGYKTAIEAYHAGPANAGKPLVLQGGTTFSDTAARLRDLIPDKILDRIEATVGSVFGVPPVVLGWVVGLENSPWSQMSEARRMAYEDTIEPRWRDIERRCTRGLLTPEERAAGYRIRFDTSSIRALFDDDELRAKVAQMMRNEWTRDERRIYTGQEPLGDDDPRGAEIGGSAGAGLMDGLLGEPGAAPKVVQAKALDDKALDWLIFDGSCKAAEKTWESRVHKGLREWRAAAVRLAGEHLVELKDIRPTSGERFLEEFGLWLDKKGLPFLRTLVYPLVLSTANQAVKQVAAKVQVSFDVFEDEILKYAERETSFLVSKMGETTGKVVADTVEKGLAEGDLIQGMTKRLEDSAGFSRTRAKLVARTETTRAWNGAQRSSLSEYAKNSGRAVTKIWLSAQDDRVRPEHAELDGEQVGIDDDFSNGLQHPGEPNCRCTLIYQVSDPVEAGPEPEPVGVAI